MVSNHCASRVDDIRPASLEMPRRLMKAKTGIGNQWMSVPTLWSVESVDRLKGELGCGHEASGSAGCQPSVLYETRHEF